MFYRLPQHPTFCSDNPNMTRQLTLWLLQAKDMHRGLGCCSWKDNWECLSWTNTNTEVTNGGLQNPSPLEEIPHTKYCQFSDLNKIYLTYPSTRCFKFETISPQLAILLSLSLGLSTPFKSLAMQFLRSSVSCNHILVSGLFQKLSLVMSRGLLLSHDVPTTLHAIPSLTDSFTLTMSIYYAHILMLLCCYVPHENVEI